MASRVAKEVFLVKKLDSILKDKEYDDIDNIFKLFTVMKQERDIAGEAYMLDESSLGVNSVKAKKLTDEQEQQLQDIRSRKLQLMAAVTEKDRKELVEITKAMKDEKFAVLGNLNSSSLKHVTNMFKDMTKEDLDAVLKKQDEYKKVDETKETFSEFWKAKEEYFAAQMAQQEYRMQHTPEDVNNSWLKEF